MSEWITRTFTETEVITRRYWVCNVRTHRHRLARTALECIRKYPEGIPKFILRWTPELLGLALEQRRSGRLIKELAREYVISPSRMSAVLRKAERLEAKTQVVQPIPADHEPDRPNP